MGDRSTKEHRQVYFIEAEGLGMVKIGLSDKPTKRLGDLQVGSPVTLHLRGVLITDDAPKLEQTFHEKFDHLRTHGEWFRIDDSVRETMANLLTPEEAVHEKVVILLKPQPYTPPVVCVVPRPKESTRKMVRRFVDECAKVGFTIA